MTFLFPLHVALILRRSNTRNGSKMKVIIELKFSFLPLKICFNVECCRQCLALRAVTVSTSVCSGLSGGRGGEGRLWEELLTGCSHRRAQQVTHIPGTCTWVLPFLYHSSCPPPPVCAQAERSSVCRRQRRRLRPGGSGSVDPARLGTGQHPVRERLRSRLLPGCDRGLRSLRRPQRTSAAHFMSTSFHVFVFQADTV